MALATTCPACSTSFKVNPEQLKLRRGLVRCGMCEHVFSGVEYLRYVSDSQTDEDLNPPNVGGDRRRGGRRSTDVEDDLDQSTTDELKTAFFLPDSELPPDYVDGTETADEPAAQAGTAEQSNTTPAKTTAASSAETDDTEPAQTESDTSDQEDQSGSDKPANGAKKLRKGGPRGRRGRGRRKKAAEARRLEKEKQAEADAAANNEAGNADQSDQPDDTAPDESGVPAPSPANSPASAKPASATPASPAPVSLSTPVVTAPLTQGSRASQGGRSARNDSWGKAPVWPRIDEHFDEPDIEEPDSMPGPASLNETAPPEAPVNDPAARQTPPRVATGQAMPSEEDAIDFFGHTSKPSFDFDLPPRSVLAIAAFLILTLIGQLAVGNRNYLAARFPGLSPILQTLSAPFGLDIELPMQIDNIKIASFDLVAASEREPEADYIMNLLIRNKASNKVRWPALELTLLDNAGGILARKVFLASDYLPDPGKESLGLAPNSEQPFRIGLKSTTTAPVGYSVSLLYP